jgi:hypothetical protein
MVTDADLDKLPDEQKQAMALEAGFARARRRFFYFCAWIKVIAGTVEEGIKSGPLKMWPHTKATIHALENSIRIVYAKSRQLGATTILAAFGLWHAMFVPNAEVVYISKSEDDAWEMLSESRAMYEKLPPELQEPLGKGIDFPNNKERMTFANGGKIITYASTETAGRGHTSTLVILDEADYHNYIDLAMTAIAPGLNDTGGALILASTVNATKATSTFQQTYKLAPINGYTKIFFGWRARPDRDDAWYATAALDYLDESLFRKEHAETEAQAFAPASGIAYFNLERLVQMEQNLRPPIRVMPVGVTEANIYQGFIPGQKYAAALDPSHGVGGNGDDAVFVIMNVNTGAIVADIQTNIVEPEQMALACIPLLEIYSLPIWAIEDNEWGYASIRAALRMRYPHLYYRDEGNKCGWNTNEHNRNNLWGELKEAVGEGGIHVFSTRGLKQFFEVIYRKHNNGRIRIEGQEGGHDDYPIACAIAWQMRAFARKSKPVAGGHMDPERALLDARTGMEWGTSPGSQARW